MRTDSKKLRWPNSLLRIMLQVIDANARWTTAEETNSPEGLTPLHHFTYQADLKHHIFHENQVILGQQLFRYGANANLGALPYGGTPLHLACHYSTVTNLDFIQLLLEKGTNQNVRDTKRNTPIVIVFPMAPGVARFLLEWCTPPITSTLTFTRPIERERPCWTWFILQSRRFPTKQHHPIMITPTSRSNTLSWSSSGEKSKRC